MKCNILEGRLPLTCTSFESNIPKQHEMLWTGITSSTIWSWHKTKLWYMGICFHHQHAGSLNVYQIHCNKQGRNRLVPLFTLPQQDKDWNRGPYRGYKVQTVSCSPLSSSDLLNSLHHVKKLGFPRDGMYNTIKIVIAEKADMDHSSNYQNWQMLPVSQAFCTLEDLLTHFPSIRARYVLPKIVRRNVLGRPMLLGWLPYESCWTYGSCKKPSKNAWSIVLLY